MRICKGFHEDGMVENGTIAVKRKGENGIPLIVKCSLRKKGENVCERECTLEPRDKNSRHKSLFSVKVIVAYSQGQPRSESYMNQGPLWRIYLFFAFPFCDTLTALILRCVDGPGLKVQ